MSSISGDFSTNLISHWMFEEESGIRVDATATGNDLTDTDSVGFSASGIQGNCADLSGSNRLEIADNASLSITGALTISAWINPDVLSATPVFTAFVNKWNETGSHRSYNFDSYDAKARFQVSVDGINTISAQSTTDMLVGGGWYHFVGVFVPSTSLKVYLDGVLEHTNTTSIPASIYDGTASFEIGHSLQLGGAERWYDGQVDEVSIWDKELSQANVTTIYNSSVGIPYTSINLIKNINGLSNIS